MSNIFFVCALIAIELIYFRIARFYKILDHPNNRSLHEKPTIRGGGIIFYLSALLFYVLTFKSDPYFIIALSIVSIVGFVDDMRSLSSILRFVVQSIAFALVLFNLNAELSYWILILILILSVGILNAFNFMDGINGLTGGYGFIALASILVVNVYHFNFIESDFIYSIIAAVVVFCYFNFRTKAVCFAGDIGSLSLGFVIIFLLTRLILSSFNFMFVFFLTVYGVDSVLTILHRLIRKENIFKAHRLHFFQIIVSSGRVSHVQMSILYMIVQLIINVALISSLNLPLLWQYSIGLVMTLLIALLYIFVKIHFMKFKGSTV